MLRNTKLILIEGLPGAGKTTAARLAFEVLREAGVQTNLFCEGNLDHPADFESVAFLTKRDYDSILGDHRTCLPLSDGSITKIAGGYLIQYRKLSESSPDLPDEVIDALARHDVYELPLDIHMNLVLNRWRQFTDTALKGKSVYVFECCFIQNPITVSMVRSDSSPELTRDYITELAGIVQPLEPVLIYVDQDDIRASFCRIIQERPKRWLDGFVSYYTQQGYGKTHGLIGLEGTIDVLKARHKLEMQILDALPMEKHLLNNSQYDHDACKRKIADIFGLRAPGEASR